MIALSDAEIRRLYGSGQSGDAIAALAGTSRHTIYRKLAALGVARRKSGSVARNVDDAAMTQLYHAGLSMAEIGRRFDLPRQVIADRLVAIGVHVVKRKTA